MCRGEACFNSLESPAGLLMFLNIIITGKQRRVYFKVEPTSLHASGTTGVPLEVWASRGMGAPGGS